MSMGLAAAFFATRGAFAEELAKTPKQTEGPFYPNKLPLDTDNDLLIINNTITPAVGEVTDDEERPLAADHLGGALVPWPPGRRCLGGPSL